MKRYGSKLLTAIFAITVLLTFSSCDKDEYWKKGTLDLQFDVTPDRNGYAEIHTTVYIDEIPEYNPNRERIVDLTTKDTWIKLGNLAQGDFFDRIDITVTGVGTFSLRDISIRDDYEYIEIDDSDFRGYYNFMSDVNHLLFLDGRVDMRIIVYSNIYNDPRYEPATIYLDLMNILDLRMRD